MEYFTKTVDLQQHSPNHGNGRSPSPQPTIIQTSSVTAGAPITQFPSVFSYYDFTTYPRVKNEILKLRCRFCDTFISGSIRVTSNFIGHLKRKHVKEYCDYVNAKRLRVELKGGNSTENSNNSHIQQHQQQQRDVISPPNPHASLTGRVSTQNHQSNNNNHHHSHIPSPTLQQNNRYHNSKKQQQTYSPASLPQQASIHHHLQQQQHYRPLSKKHPQQAFLIPDSKHQRPSSSSVSSSHPTSHTHTSINHRTLYKQRQQPQKRKLSPYDLSTIVNGRSSSTNSTSLGNQALNSTLLNALHLLQQEQQQASTSSTSSTSVYPSLTVDQQDHVSSTQSSITKHFVQLLIQMSLPLSVLEDKSFQEFILLLNSSYQLPTRQQFYDQILSTYLQETESRLKQILSEQQFLILKFNLLTTTTKTITQQNQQIFYILVSCQYIDDDWLPHCYLLTCQRFRLSFPNYDKLISNVYDYCMEKYELSSQKIGIIIVDNACNIVKVYRELSLPGWKLDAGNELISTENDESMITTVNDGDENDTTNESENNSNGGDGNGRDNQHQQSGQQDDWQEVDFDDVELFASKDVDHVWQYCFSYLLQRCMKEIYSSCSILISPSISKLCKIINHLQMSDILLSSFRKLNGLLNQYNQIRWTFQMKILRSIFNVYYIGTECVPHELRLTHDERLFLKELIELLEPFEEAIDLLQTESSISKILPSYRGLKLHLEKFQAQSSSIKQIRDLLTMNFSKTFENLETNEHLILSAICDPNFAFRWTNSLNDETQTYQNLLLRSLHSKTNLLSFHQQHQSQTQQQRKQAKSPTLANNNNNNSTTSSTSKLFSYMNHHVTKQEVIQFNISTFLLLDKNRFYSECFDKIQKHTYSIILTPADDTEIQEDITEEDILDREMAVEEDDLEDEEDAEAMNIIYEKEILDYIQLVNDPLQTSLSKDAYEFWRTNSHQIPNIARLAKRLLAIPSTSVYIERLFHRQGTGTILKPLSSFQSMTNQHFSDFLFLKANQNVLSKMINNSSSTPDQLVDSMHGENIGLYTELNAEKIQDFQAAFSLLDIDSNGTVGTQEIQLVARAAGMELPESEIQLLIGSADEDHSGGIDIREFVSMMTTTINPQDLEEELKQTFKVFDKDDSGSINADELKKFVRLFDSELSEDEASDMIQQADLKGTGGIDYDQFIQFLLHA
ncbi:unnamed protein product [Didymodactylos carnosus]|uniref:EF-hand domain-containing protein n=1 Tax=Didymodactylos carnosus TaxID=1234261 RepID=A0A814H900_9BILA|nr:unnamed protein product [Didymodactylos carnosus]CAF1097558.1 unnamed protein product [Didymodactylos carnosus]CAF3778702.1 unnamed protein product [Didymodactylos carnosus]CAF3859039.1 unnamed protein product [Didymodactylos carnosus]